MTLLHDYFLLRNIKAFQRLLDAGNERGQSNATLSTSVGKSWTRASTFKVAQDINARDWLGRTVLHLACADLDSLEYVRLLLRQPAINVNAPDTESHWTPLHRALYNGNLPAALLLLQRADIDRSVQDYEGYTAFDLYNSTLEGTKPARNKGYHELYTWGANRNAALGVGDGSDRLFADTIVIGRKDESEESEEKGRVSRFQPIRVGHIDMSRLHTAIITNEGKGNLRLCGFGSGGRLGPGQHTQFNFTPLQQFSYTIVSVALGQDHTLALTSSGEILSWGLNRFSQLGYVIENPTSGDSSARIQPTPRKIQGPLKKEIIMGVAATKTASACWTETDVYTWGMNNGQLGYDRTGQPQILPRKATKVTSPVLAIAMTDVAMSCLLTSHDVVCVWNDRSVKLQFPIHAFPSEIQPYQPPQAIKNAKIAKVVGCDETFAALSFNGELFTFFPPGSMDPAIAATAKDKSGFKPQRVWALRKKFSSVRDVALGSDGSMIICTVSGHVFTRSRNPSKTGQQSSSKPFKFQRVPYLQRIVQVCANSTGAFSALKEEYSPTPISTSGNTLSQDLARLLPFLQWFQGSAPPRVINMFDEYGDLLEEEFDSHLDQDIKRLAGLLEFLEKQKLAENNQIHDRSKGADVIIHLPGGCQAAAHGVILSSRCPLLKSVLNGKGTIKSDTAKIAIKCSRIEPGRPHPTIHISFTGCYPLTVLILLGFLYSDEVLAIWDRRLYLSLEPQIKALRINPAHIKQDLRALAELLNLSPLFPVLEKPVKQVPSPSLSNAMQRLYDSAQKDSSVPMKSVFAPDVILHLADKEIHTHSMVLRARSIFFADFFGEEDWTRNRWNEDGVIHIDMKHLTCRVMDFVLRFMCCGVDDGIFDFLPGVHSVDELLDFVFEVMAAANELLLDRLVSLCSTVILQYINLHNASYVLAEASYLDADDLTNRIQKYIAVNMESFLETGMLDEIPHSLIKRLSKFIKIAQADKSPVSRSGILGEQALVRHADWLALQDIPRPIDERDIDLSVFIRQPSTPKKKKARVEVVSLMTSPVSPPTTGLHHRASTEDIFQMDDGDGPSVSDAAAATQSPSVGAKAPPAAGVPVWKATSVPRVDMKTLMAEAANTSPSKTAGSTLARISPPTAAMATHRSQQELRRAGSSSENVRGLASSAGPPAGSPLRPGPQPRQRVPSGLGEAAGDTHPAPPTTPSRRGESSAEAQGQFPALSPFKKPSTPKTPQKTPGTPSGPELGPFITPSRQPVASGSNPPNPRRASGKVWNQASSAAPPVVTTGMSFAAIQQLEEDLLAGGPKQEKRSLVEIQQEEKDRQQEADFLAWWTAEEERVRLETEAAVAASQQEAAGSSKSRRGGNQKRGGRRENPSQGQSQTSTRGGAGGSEGGGSGPHRPPRKPKKTEH